MMKKLFAILLALALVLSLTVTAFAADTYTLSVVSSEATPTAGHSYKVYQIFTGVLNESKLVYVKYGSNFGSYKIGSTTYTGTVDEDVPDEVLEAIGTTAAEAEAFAKAIVLKGNAVATLNAANGFKADLTPGYYLIVDDTNIDIPDGDNYSKYMVQVVADVQIQPKSTTEKIEKKLSDDHHGLICTSTEAGHVHNKDCYVWSESNEVSIGETVHFQLKSDVPAPAADYEIYYFVIGDTICKGLSVDASSIAVYADGVKLNASAYTLTGPKAVAAGTTGAYAGGSTFEIALKDAKSYAGQSIEVYYDAILNADAVIGTTGNPNEAILKYERNPYSDSKDQNNDGYPDEGEEYVWGTTPADDTITYATGIKFMKVDENGDPLQGAEFTVTGTAYNTKLNYTESYTVSANGDYYKLNTGKYTTVAPTKDRMVEKTDRKGGYVVVEAGFIGKTVTVDGTTYREAVEADMEGTATLYEYIKGTEDQYDSTETKYVLNGTWTPCTVSQSINVVLTPDKDGIVTLAGLGDGVYHVSETVVPDGYVQIPDFDITIAWGAPTAPVTAQSECTWTATAETAKTTENPDGALNMNADGVFEIEVINQSGTELPTTGGIGTTLFYVIGGILLLGAAVLLITKKRMSAAND